MLADEGAGRTRVIEVDVGEQEMSDLAEFVPSCGKPRSQRRQRGCWTAIEQSEAVVGLDEVTTDAASVARVQEIDRCG